MKFGWALVSLLATVLWANGAVPAADFSAEVVNISQGKTVRAKIYVQAEKIRMEMPGVEDHTIVRSDRQVVWVVIPEDKTYVELPSPPAPGTGAKAKMKGEINRTYLGSETVNGFAAEKYEVHYRDQEKVHKAYQWIAADLDYPIKISALDGSWSTEYRNIQMGAQPESLFEIPPGFARVAETGPAPEKP